MGVINQIIAFAGLTLYPVPQLHIQDVRANFNKVVLECVREKYRSKMANCLVAIIYLLVGWSKPVYSRCM